MANYTVAGLRNYYLAKWNNMVITRSAAVEKAAMTIVANRSRYMEIEKATGVPWKMIGVIHMRESSCNFRTHLHNGNPLTARTYLVPAGRPIRGKPPFTFEESAIDALTYQKLNLVKSWPLEQMCYSLEAYNGWGYRYKGFPSAYLWAGSNQYVSGKYIADGVWSDTTVDVQLGVMPMLKRICELTKEPLSPFLETPPPVVTTAIVADAPVETSSESYKAKPAAPTSKELRTVSRKFFLTDLAQWFTGGVAGLVALIQAITLAQIQALSEWVTAVRTFTNDNGLWLGCMCLLAFGIYLTLMKGWMKEDVVEGRSNPSGELPVTPSIPAPAGVPEAPGASFIVAHPVDASDLSVDEDMKAGEGKGA